MIGSIEVKHVVDGTMVTLVMAGFDRRNDVTFVVTEGDDLKEAVFAKIRATPGAHDPVVQAKGSK